MKKIAALLSVATVLSFTSCSKQKTGIPASEDSGIHQANKATDRGALATTATVATVPNTETGREVMTTPQRH